MRVLRIADCGLRIADCGLRAACVFWGAYASRVLAKASRLGGLLSRVVAKFLHAIGQRLVAKVRFGGTPKPTLGTSVLPGFAGLVFLAMTATVPAADRVDEALLRATQYLLQQQDETGAISNKMRNETAMTSLSILALASVGYQAGDPSPEGQAMKKALAYVTGPEIQEKDGYLGQKDGSRMYGHGIATLMLAEMLGMGVDAQQDELIRDKCRKALDLILRAQKVPKNESSRGGWRYTPDTSESDMSVTVWQTMALRAAKNAGLDVPKGAIEDAVKYIKRCYEPDASRNGDVKLGGFGYQGKGRELSTTAEGLLALQVCGEYESEEVRSASDRLLKSGLTENEKWLFYLTYYYAQGMYQRGGKHAEEGRKVVADVLLPMQNRDGSWEGKGGEERGGGKVYATAMAVLSLAVKNHYLPIYQR